MESELEPIVRKLAEAHWPWRIHATYDESIGRFLDIFERVHRDTPIDKLRWFIDHAETISERNLERIQALGGGIATQHRMAYQGEYFIRRYGIEAAKRKPPLQANAENGFADWSGHRRNARGELSPVDLPLVDGYLEDRRWNSVAR